MKTRRLAVLLSALLAPLAARAATFTVMNTNDSGPGSLRQAILDANSTPGADTIVFNIPSLDPGCVGGVCTIKPATPFDPISDPVFIDGYTQPGSSPNTDPVADNAVLLIELDGSSAPSGIGLLLAGSGSHTVQGLVVGGWLVGIATFNNTGGGSTNVIRGNFLGTDPTGSSARPNAIAVQAAVSGDLIGGTTPADRNLVSGSTAGIFGGAIEIVGGVAATVQGNLIGTDKTGMLAIPNGDGIYSNGPATIGGSVPGAGNVISGNSLYGIFMQADVLVQGNRIGTTADGTRPLGNAIAGVVNHGSLGRIGGPGAGEGNVIAFNGAHAVDTTGDGTSIRGNSIHDNGGLGIDLGAAGPNFNDPGDADDGNNHLQNFPIIQSVTFGASTTTVQGKFNSAALTAFEVDFYANPACSNFPREFLEGRTYLGSIPVSTDASGNATFNAVLPVVVAAGSKISATATDPAGNTSEFSQRILFSISPTSGDPAGGTGISLSGTDFADPTTMTIGAAAASGVAFVNDHSLTATTPALAAGAAYDVVVTTPDGTTGTLSRGWVADFLDAPSSHPFNSFVNKLVSNGLTAGVGGGNYGVSLAVTRAQMAVFLLRGKNGLCFLPPPATGTVFADVPAGSFAAAWIEALAAAQVTGGCGNGNYCPSDPVTRAQMAVFLLRTLEGPAYLPPACVTPTFNDVPCASGFARWVDELALRGVTAGCGGGNYCPSDSVTRGQMAVFLTTTFALP